MVVENEEFLRFLTFEDLQAKYISDKRTRFRQLDEKFKNEGEFRKESKRQGIQNDRKHRDILNSCIYPFTNKGSLAFTGYKYIRSAPLLELDLPNFDFLLFKRRDRNNIAILGECKGSVGNPSSILAEAIERKNIAIENVSYIKSNYLQLSEEDQLSLEFVIAIPSNEAHDVVSAVVDSGGGFVVWHAPFTGNSKISIAFPAQNVNINRQTMMHAEQTLNQNLQNAESNRRAFNVFLQSHPVSKLYPLVFTASPGESGLEVKEEDVLMFLSENDLFYLEASTVEDTTKQIIKSGEDIDFLERLPTEGVYKIKARGTKRSTIETTLQDKWVKYKIADDLKKEKEKAIANLQQHYREERGKRKSLGDYVEKSDG